MSFLTNELNEKCEGNLDNVLRKTVLKGDLPSNFVGLVDLGVCGITRFQ